MANARTEILFNDSWQFVKLPFGSDLKEASKDNVLWQPIELPHDWLIYDTNDLYGDASGWYRKSFELNKCDDKCYFINFDGVYMDSTVYVNDREAGTNRYGYNSFEYEITDLLTDGINTVMVEVRHKSPNTRWYSGAGIFRDVTFKETSKIHIVSDGIYFHTDKLSDRCWKVTSDTEITGADDISDIELRHDIRLLPTDPSDVRCISKPCKGTEDFVIADLSHGDNCSVCAHPCGMREKVKVSDAEYSGLSLSFCIDNPFVWDITSPNLYELKTEVYYRGELTDVMTNVFGLREARFTTDKGFYLNGRRIKLYGVCEHHDLGALGAAFNSDAMRRKFMILKEMGVNAVRTSHNMPSKRFMELADRMGILVLSEAYDMWLRPKTEFDYARFFKDDHVNTIASWVRRDRNHPSVIMWSVGNEIYDCHADASAVELTGRLKENVEKHDPKANAVVTFGSNFMPWEGARNCADVLKVVGYNYGEKCYDEHHDKHPDWVIYGSETSSTVQSRGVYHFPLDVCSMADDDEQCSTLGNCTTSWGAPDSEYVVRADRDHDYSLGQFLWSGFDYIGEPTPYHTKNSYFGQIDTAGFPKDTYYVYKAEWTDVKQVPFVHLYPYWDFNEGQIIDVRAASNCDSVKLIVNDEAMECKCIDHEHGEVLVPSWKVPYHKGYIEAIGYDAFGNEIARDRKDSFGDAAELRYRLFDFGRDSLCANGNDLIFMEIYAVDSEGHEVENANNRVSVSVTGSAVLRGLDNGDSTDYEQYKCNSRRMFAGKLLAVIGATKASGPFEVSVQSEGLRGFEYVNSCEPSEYTDACDEAHRMLIPCDPDIEVASDCAELPICHDIPIRKIDLVTDEGNVLTKDRSSITVTARIYPHNASYDEITWVAVNDSAVKTNLAKLEPCGNTCRITAMGDGAFRLRAMCKNGESVYKVISVLEFKNEGIGQAYLDPYDFIAGSLYTDARGDIGNGNEKGVATSRLGDSYVGYEHIDFGDFGADEITIPIFTLSGDEYKINLWEGRPGEPGSELLLAGTYCKPSIWNVYQEETYKLRRRVKGVTSIYFTADAKYHIKGFSFKRPDKAFETINVTENSRIYGDTYTLNSDGVTSIGNNVTIEFDDMLFGERTATKLVICGRTKGENNSLHVKAASSVTSSAQLIEFSHSDDYEEREFAIEPISGDVRISFVFLPGCDFDMKWFRFE